MKRIAVFLVASALAALLAGCEPAHQNIVDTAEPLDTAHQGVKEAPGVGESATEDTAATATVAPATTTETATETAAQQSTRTQ